MLPDKHFGEMIRQLREAKAETDVNFSLRKFAQSLGLSPSYISMMERGEVTPPKAENIKRMATLLGCGADQLLALGDKVDPELEIIIKENPETVPELLRIVGGMPSEQLKSIRDFAVFQKGQK